MPRLKYSVPKLCKHKASGRAYVTIAGVEHGLGKFGSAEAQAEYERIIGEYLVSGRSAAAVNSGDRKNIDQVIVPFLEYAKGYYVKDGKFTTEYHAFRRVCISIRRLYGSKPADEFGPLALKALRESWINAGLARKSVNQNQGRVVRIFRWAVAEELVHADVWKSLSSVDGLRKGRTIAAEPEPVMPVDLATIEQTLPHLSPVVRDMIRMQLLTGMRPGEVCCLRPMDVDRSQEVWEYTPGRHKTEHHGRTRTVYLGPQAIAILGPYLFRDPEAACFSAAESREWFREQRAAKRTTPESCGNARGRRGKRSPKGRPPKPKTPVRAPRTYFDTSSYGQAIGYACRKAWPVPESIAKNPAAAKQWEIEHRWSPNQIRHTRGTEVRKQFGLEGAQIILGHASADVTQIYAERDADLGRLIARQTG